jgi:endonuclease-3
MWLEMTDKERARNGTGSAGTFEPRLPHRPELTLDRWILDGLDALEVLWSHERHPPELGHEEPLDGLILTVLSQNTNDKNRDAAFANLKDSCPVWETAAPLPATELASLIKSAGLSQIKAERILNLLAQLKRDFGVYSLAPLGHRTLGEIAAYLSGFPGVGPKTVACVLLFEFGLPRFPVDTHIGRVCRRIGWVPPKMPAEQIEEVMETHVPPSRYLGAHVNIITHGRQICKAQKPLCPQCSLRSLCAFGSENQGI